MSMRWHPEGMSPRTAAERRLETVHLVRHAHAGDAERWEGPDELRPLTAKGRRQAERLGASWSAPASGPTASSAAPRSGRSRPRRSSGGPGHRRSTWTSDCRAAAPWPAWTRVLGDAGARAPMVVGHDPDFSLLLSELIGSTRQEMRKGAFATIDVRRPLRPGAGMLRWLMPPELLLGPVPVPSPTRRGRRTPRRQSARPTARPANTASKPRTHRAHRGWRPPASRPRLPSAAQLSSIQVENVV